MSIINGDTFKGAIDFITKLLDGLNKIGSWTSIFNIALLAQSLKTVGTLLVNGFSEPMSKVISVYR